ncbi:MAG: COX15/CtaA family protein [Candidatus Eiseniibacteriota bacterium]
MGAASTMLPQFGRVARLAQVLVVLTFGLIVLGAIVRATGSGLACPDWPLCHGRLLPPLQPQVLLEWSHRFVALCVSLLTAALAIWILAARPLRRALGGFVVLALGLLALQVLLGALTVWKLLHFSVVTLHLGNALLFFAVLIAIAERAARLERAEAGPSSSGAPRAVFAFASGATLAQILLGGLVSTNHAGLACPDFPTCHGEWWPPLEGLVGLQMLHRYGAYGLGALLVLVWWRSRAAADVRIRAGAEVALSLLVVQIVLGVMNVLLAVPVWITAAHLATATVLFALLVLTTLRAFARPMPTGGAS